MASDTPKRIRVAPLRELKVEPVTDPAELAALEERRKRNDASARTRGGAGGTVSIELPHLFQDLAEPNRLPTLMQMVAQLSPQERQQLAESLVAGLPADALASLREQLRMLPAQG
jgi:hypothetical protein